jgi:fatty-acyl-CoA synthase
MRLIKSATVLRRWGTSIAGGYASAAIRRPNATALIDDAGSLSYAELDRRANQLARGFRAAGISAGDGIAVLHIDDGVLE